jgi:transcription elongation factor GreA
MAVHLTQEGYDRLNKELHHLATVKRREIAEALEVARAKGDLRENAEYDAAKNEQAHLEKRIHDLQEKLAHAKILDHNAISSDKVYLGAHVTLMDENRKTEIRYMIVSKEEADLKTGKISSESPIGRALIGKSVGDKVEVTIPAGTLKYKVLKIER